MLTALDDLPRHELPDAPDAYERYFFLAAAPDGSEAVSLVVNVHPHKGVIDAAFAHSDGDTHDSLFATDRLGDDLTCGPIRLTLDDPMRSLRIEVEDRVDLRFDASHPAIEEERVTRRRDGRVVQDRSRYAQLGTTSDGWFAGRDHSWGIWDSAGRSHSPSFFWLIGAFDDHAVQAVTHIDTDGRRYGEYGAIVRAGAPQEAREVTRLEVEGPSHFTYGAPHARRRDARARIAARAAAARGRLRPPHVGVGDGPAGAAARTR